MENSILRSIIDVEKEIQEKILVEERKSREKLEKVRQEVDLYIAREEERLRAVSERSIDTARREAEKKARKMVADSAALSKKIEDLDNDVLIKVVPKHLEKILPVNT